MNKCPYCGFTGKRITACCLGWAKDRIEELEAEDKRFKKEYEVNMHNHLDRIEELEAEEKHITHDMLLYQKQRDKWKRKYEALVPIVIGWCHAYFCAALDDGKDPRQIEVPEILEKADQQLNALLEDDDGRD